MAVADDPADGFVLLLGATGGPGPENGTQTWTFSEGVWTEAEPATFPESCIGSSLAYDPFDGYVVYQAGGNLVPGENCTSAGETWSYRAGAWTELSPTISPVPRQGAAFTNDSTDGYMLLFGGLSSACDVTCNDTWAFRQGNWTQLTEPISPSNRSGAGMADDLFDGYVVLFGGTGSPSSCTRQHQDDPYCMFRDTWSFRDGTWAELYPVGAVPPEPFTDGMVYDGALQRVLYTVTDTNSSLAPGIWWTFHAGNWTDSGPDYEDFQGIAPPNRFGEGLAFDWNDGYSMLYGGTGIEFQPFNDTWRYVGSNWTNITQSTGSEGPTYQMTVSEQGLPAGTDWGLYLGPIHYSSTLPAFPVWLENGSIGFSVDEVPGYVATPSNGTLVVDGSPGTLGITFSPGNLSTDYNLTFREDGLPPGTPWAISIDGITFRSASSAQSFAVMNGTVLVRGPGHPRLRGRIARRERHGLGGSGPHPVEFTATLVGAVVEFTETGLPLGTSWFVTLGATEAVGAGASLVLLVPTGAYSFNVSTEDGYAASPGPGSSRCRVRRPFWSRSPHRHRRTVPSSSP